MKIRIYPGDDDGVDSVCRELKSGKVVALPTETVYGLAADALRENSCRKIFDIKMRPLVDPLIVHFHSTSQLSKIAIVPELLGRVGEKFWPGPLTVVLKKKRAVPDLVTAGRQSVAVRMPALGLARMVLEKSGLLLAAPSANPFGYVSPTRADHVVESLGDKIGSVLDGGECEIGLESTILDLTDPEKPAILRLGPIGEKELEDALGQRVALKVTSQNQGKNCEGLLAPGTLSKHYSPRVNLTLHSAGEMETIRLPYGIQGHANVYFQRPRHNRAAQPDTFWLSEGGDTKEAAKNLFELLRNLDRRGYRTVNLEKAPPGGLGDAINDRLQRAAAKS